MTSLPRRKLRDSLKGPEGADTKPSQGRTMAWAKAARDALITSLLLPFIILILIGLFSFAYVVELFLQRQARAQNAEHNAPI